MIPVFNTLGLVSAMFSLHAGTAQQSTPAKDNPVTYGGYLDVYYQFDSGRPHADLNDRLFDVMHNTPTLAEADLDILKAPSAKVQFGFTINAIGGRSSELLHATEPGGKGQWFQYVGQAYGTYVSPGAHPLTVDFGQFYTWIGAESYDSRTQDNYSRSFDNDLTEPDYHLGLRLTYPVTPKLTANFYGVNGWNEFRSSHSGKSCGATLNYQATDKLNITLQNYDGKEGSDTPNDSGTYGGIGFPNPGTLQVHLFDGIVTYQARPGLKFVLCTDYASADGANGGHWDGEVFLVKKLLSKTNSVTLRLDRASDTDGLRTGASVLLRSITGTYDMNLSRKGLTRIEVRQDYADSPTFASDSGPTKQRTTYTLAQIWHF